MTVLRDDLTTRAAYVSDASIYRRLPAAVAEPSSVAEIRELLATARENGWSVVPAAAARPWRATRSARDW